MSCIHPFHSSVWSRCSGFIGPSPSERSVASPPTSRQPHTPQKLLLLSTFGPRAKKLVRSHR